jgi:hypothetical protein
MLDHSLTPGAAVVIAKTAQPQVGKPGTLSGYGVSRQKCPALLGAGHVRKCPAKPNSNARFCWVDGPAGHTGTLGDKLSRGARRDTRDIPPYRGCTVSRRLTVVPHHSRARPRQGFLSMERKKVLRLRPARSHAYATVNRGGRT